MKKADNLAKIECLQQGKWVSVQDIRQLEVGDIVRMVTDRGNLIVVAGGKTAQAVQQPAQLKMRILTHPEYEQVLLSVTGPRPIPKVIDAGQSSDYGN